jgi:hypothetical protein
MTLLEPPLPPCQPNADDPEPPPSTRSACLNLPNPLQCPQQTAPVLNSLNCVSHTPCPKPKPTTRASRSVLESSASRESTRGVVVTQTQVRRARAGMKISDTMEGMRTSGCSMISVSQMQLRRGGDGFLGRRKMMREIGMRREDEGIVVDTKNSIKQYSLKLGHSPSLLLFVTSFCHIFFF